MKPALLSPMLLLAALLLTPAARAQAPSAQDCATRAGFAEALAKRRDNKEAQGPAAAALLKDLARNTELPERRRQALGGLVNESARLAFSLPQLAPADVALVQRLACTEGDTSPSRIGALAATAQACAAEAPAQTPAARVQCVSLKAPAGRAR